MPAPPHSRRGFTLIELVVVMALIGLLISIAAPRYYHVMDNGRITIQRQNRAVIRDALDKFVGDLGRYPDSLDELVAKRYLREVPIDPVSGLRTWETVAPTDGTAGSVYDVRPPQAVASQVEAS